MKKLLTALISAAVIAMPLAVISTSVAAKTGTAVVSGKKAGMDLQAKAKSKKASKKKATKK